MSCTPLYLIHDEDANEASTNKRSEPTILNMASPPHTRRTACLSHYSYSPRFMPSIRPLSRLPLLISIHLLVPSMRLLSYTPVRRWLSLSRRSYWQHPCWPFTSSLSSMEGCTQRCILSRIVSLGYFWVLLSGGPRSIRAVTSMFGCRHLDG